MIAPPPQARRQGVAPAAARCAAGRRAALRPALRGAVLAVALLAGGCVSMGTALRQDERPAPVLPDPPMRAPPATAETAEHQRITQAFGGAYREPILEALIRDTVDRLAASSERPDLRYTVTLLNSPAINAFALPNGSLFLTRGLVALANDRAELASVLAHEMAHVILRHAESREDQLRRAQLVSRVATDVLRDGQAGRMTLARSQVTLAGFSRAQELEADALGVRILAAAGYDPHAASRLLANMQRTQVLRASLIGRGGEPVDFLATHPSTEDRIRTALSNARQITAPGTGVRERGEFLATLEGLAYGDDPSEGFVRGRRFIHPRLGFTFTAPEGFVLENSQSAVLGLNAGVTQAFRFDAVDAEEGKSLRDQVASGWVDGVDPASVSELEINGFRAATAIARSDDWTFRLVALKHGNGIYRMVFAARTLDEATDRRFREAAATFRRIGRDEAASARPYRLQVVDVKPGDTVQALANRMAYAERRLDRFLVLNGLDPGATLTPGDRVKVVVE